MRTAFAALSTLLAVAAASCAPQKTVVFDRLELAAKAGKDQVVISDLLPLKDGWLCVYSFTSALPETEREAVALKALNKSFHGLDDDEYIYIVYPDVRGAPTIERVHAHSTNIRFDVVPDKACATVYGAIGVSYSNGVTHLSVRW